MNDTDLVKSLLQQIESLKLEIEKLKTNSQATILIGDNYPKNPINNQIIIRIDKEYKMFVYNGISGIWIKVN